MKILLAILTLVLSVHAEVYVVEMEHELNQSELSKLNSLSGVKKVEKFLPIESEYLNRLYEITTDSEKQKELESLNFVRLAEKDHMVEAFEIKPKKDSEMTTNDMLFPFQWALQNQNQLIVAQRPNGGKLEVRGVKGVDVQWKDNIDRIESFLKKRPMVAVIDMGIDLDHPDLAHAIFKNEVECDKDPDTGEFTFQRLKDGRREDRDRNGFPGDCMGWNFATDSPLFEVTPEDDTGHGTHVSGIIAAKRNNDIGIAGLSDKIAIVPLRVTGRVDETNDKDRLRYRSASRRIAKAIFYAARRRVDVINLSLGWPSSMNTQFMRNAIAEAERLNVLVVAAAGNNNSKANIYPCAYDSVVCVGSIDADGSMSRFSNYGGEVDLLAPGDQIISTYPVGFIPLKRNEDGYDIMSGTSQAAPYVSAIASLLKSIVMQKNEEGQYVPVPNNEIKRRLFDTARAKNDIEKSQFGLVQLDNALKIGMMPSIRPLVKSFSEVTYNPDTMLVDDLSFGVENLGAGSPNIQIKLISHNPGLKIEGDGLIKLAGMNPGQKIRLNYKAKVVDSRASSTVKLEIQINTPNLGVRRFFHEIYVSRAVDLEKNVYPIKLDKKLNLIAFRNEIKDSTVWTEADLTPDLRELWKKLNRTDRKTNVNIKTVDSPYSNDLPDFFMLNKNEKDVVLTLIRNQGLEYRNAKEMIFKDTYQVTDVIKMDFNYDKKDDYLVKSIEIVDNKSFKIVRTYLNSELKPLFKGKSRIVKYEDRNSIKVTPQTQRFMKTKLPSGEYVAAPIFVTQGLVPEVDQDQDPWIPKDRSFLRRVYRLEVKAIDGELVYVPRTVMNRNFVTKIRESYSYLMSNGISKDDTGIELIGLLNQSKEDFYQGVVKGMLSYGLGFERYNLLMKFQDEKHEIKYVSNVKNRLVGNSIHKHFDLDNYIPGFNNTFVGFQTNSLINLSVSDGENEKALVYRLYTPFDRLQSFIASYTLRGKEYLFFETIDDLLMIYNDGHKQVESRLNTTKFSFLPGTVMSDLFFPISLLRDGELSPAIYVDTTAVVGSRIYTMTPNADQLNDPMELSVKLPQVCGVQDRNCGLSGNADTKYCLALNPYEDAKGHHSYILLCKDKEEYLIKQVEL
jgi:cell wall-associated protease